MMRDAAGERCGRVARIDDSQMFGPHAEFGRARAVARGDGDPTPRPPGRTTLAVRPLIAAMSTGKKFMLGEPMKAATNLLAGAL